MILPASYSNGFAPRDGQPRYPELWRGCVGAWNPGLGPSGLTLRDNSGLGNNGTLTNGPTYAASQGKYAMKFDGVDDYVNFGNLSVVNFGTSPFAFGTWVKGGTNGCEILAKTPISGDTGLYIANRSVSGNYYYYNGAVTDIGAKDGKWHHLAISRLSTASSDTRLYYDGILAVTITDSQNKTNANNFTIGGLVSNTFASCEIADVQVYNRALSPNEIRTLATRRGIAYELAPRRRSSSAVAAFNRRRRLLLGSI